MRQKAWPWGMPFQRPTTAKPGYFYTGNSMRRGPIAEASGALPWSQQSDSHASLAAILSLRGQPKRGLSGYGAALRLNPNPAAAGLVVRHLCHAYPLDGAG